MYDSRKSGRLEKGHFKQTGLLQTNRTNYMRLEFQCLTHLLFHAVQKRPYHAFSSVAVIGPTEQTNSANTVTVTISCYFRTVKLVELAEQTIL